MGRGCEEGKEEDTVERQQDVGSREPILEEVQQNHKALNQTYTVAYTPSVTGLGFNAENHIIIGTVKLWIIEEG